MAKKRIGATSKTDSNSKAVTQSRKGRTGWPGLPAVSKEGYEWAIKICNVRKRGFSATFEELVAESGKEFDDIELLVLQTCYAAWLAAGYDMTNLALVQSLIASEPHIEKLLKPRKRAVKRRQVGH